MHKHKNDMASVLARDYAYYHQIKANIDDLSSENDRRQDLERRTRAELVNLNRELENLDLQISMQDLLAIQGKAATLQEHIEGLSQVAASEQEKINALEHNNTVTLAALLEERENLLADIASGVRIEEGQSREA